MSTSTRTEAVAAFPLHAKWLPLGDAIAQTRRLRSLSVFEVAERSGLDVDLIRSIELAVAPGTDPSARYDGPSDEQLERLSLAIDSGDSGVHWISMARSIRGVRSKA